MTPESESDSRFKMDDNQQHITNDFFFDSGDHDNFNDFVNSNHEGMHDFVDHGSSHDNSTPNNTHLNSLNHPQQQHFHNQSHHNSVSMDINLNSLHGLNHLSTLHDNNHTSNNTTTPNENRSGSDNNNNNNSNNNNNNNNLGEGINDDDGNSMSMNMNMDMNINDMDMEPLHYLNNSNDKLNNLSNSGSDNEIHLSSSFPMKQKSSPKKAMDKRRGSLSLDDTTNSQKRTRASGEILNYLMNEFNNNSNPTTVMRKEIALKTGMPERSVRIWFQNRRAKARKMEKLNQNSNANTNDSNDNDKDVKSNNNSKDDLHSNDSASSITPNMTSGNNNAMQYALSKMNTLPMEINGKYYLIECKSLSVGSWQRIRSGYVKSESLKRLNNLSPRLLCEIMSTTDLLVILSKKDQELNYFFSGVFQNEKVLFRIFYPIINILKCSLLNQTQSMNNNENYNSDYSETLLQIELGASPQFAVHFSRDPTTGKENANQWSICEDFSEGQQVAAAFTGEGGTGLPHILSDDLDRLKYLNTLISSLNKSESSKIMSSSMNLSDSQMKLTHQNQFSPLNQVSTNNSTPASINTLPNYSGFPQPSTYSLNINDEEVISQDLMYDPNDRQSQQQMNNQQQQQLSQHSSQLQTPTPQQQHPQRMFSSSASQKKNSQQQIIKPSFLNGSTLSNNLSIEGMFNSGTVDSDQGDSKLESSDLDLFRQGNHNDDENDNETVDTPNTNMNMGMNMSNMSMNIPMSIMPVGMSMNMPMNMNLNMPIMNMAITPNINEPDSNLLDTTNGHMINSISGVDGDDDDDLLKATDENIHDNRNETEHDGKDNTNVFMKQDDEESFFLGF